VTTKKSKPLRQPGVVTRFRHKRLKTKGWKVGSVREFLDLTNQEEAYIELQLNRPRLLSITDGTSTRNCQKQDLTH